MDTSSTLLGPTKNQKSILYLSFAMIGLIVGYFATGIVKWIIGLSWIPYHQSFELVNKVLLKIQSLSGDWSAIILAIIGACLGLFLAFLCIEEILRANISDQEIVIYKDDHTYAISKDEIQHVFLDEKELVIVDLNGQELLRETHHHKEKIVEDAFVFHRYPWEQGDPYEKEFQLWTAKTKEVSNAVHALMKAREKALEDKNDEEARELRKGLADLNIVVRTRGTKQYWRFAMRHTEHSA